MCVRTDVCFRRTTAKTVRGKQRVSTDPRRSVPGGGGGPGEKGEKKNLVAVSDDNGDNRASRESGFTVNIPAGGTLPGCGAGDDGKKNDEFFYARGLAQTVFFFLITRSGRLCSRTSYSV